MFKTSRSRIECRFRCLFTGLAVLIFFAGGLSPLLEGSAQVQKVSNENTVKISAEPQQILPGSTTTITVSMSSVKAQPREILWVYLPESMQLVGTPYCTGDCSQASATPGSNELKAILQFNGTPQKQRTSAQLTFTALVSSDTKPGTYPQISAYLGSPAATDWIEISIETPPIAPTPLPANLSLSVSPDGAVLGPDGSFTIFAYPYIPLIQGVVTEQLATMPSMVVRATVPKGLSLEQESACFELGSSTPSMSPLCVIEASGDESNISFITVDIPSQEHSVGIFLRFQNKCLDTKELHSLSLTLEETSNSVTVNNPTATLDIVAVDSLKTLGADTTEGSVNVLFIDAKPGCTESRVTEGTKLSIKEWGDNPILSSSSARSLTNADSIAPLDDHCPMLIAFEDVKLFSLYLIGVTPPGMDDFFCRACVLGTVPWSNNAIPIIKTRYNN